MMKRKLKAFINNYNVLLLTRTKKIMANLNMPVQIEIRTNKAIMIMRKSVDFTVELSFNKTTTIDLRYLYSQQQHYQTNRTEF